MVIRLGHLKFGQVFDLIFGHAKLSTRLDPRLLWVYSRHHVLGHVRHVRHAIRMRACLQSSGSLLVAWHPADSVSMLPVTQQRLKSI
uniref:HDC13297 n=1 Tax=Drosophila melanogaster TaxID=7227 RepID=Q6IK64_DROME|nr:TPA_inf: HDC13297 [Drosophila melanogaster]